jgi:hypothetical protein
MSMQRRVRSLAVVMSLAALAACERTAEPTKVSSGTAEPFQISASIQDLMLHEIEPAAEGLWDAVSTTVSLDGIEEKMPRTEEEWFEARSRAITLLEATNLLVMKGRKILNPGQKMADEGVPGVLTPAEVEARFEANHDQFVQFAHVLRAASEHMLKAIDAKDVQGMIDAGEPIYEACEACHLTFWYPNQVIPEPQD